MIYWLCNSYRISTLYYNVDILIRIAMGNLANILEPKIIHFEQFFHDNSAQNEKLESSEIL